MFRRQQQPLPLPPPDPEAERERWLTQFVLVTVPDSLSHGLTAGQEAELLKREAAGKLRPVLEAMDRAGLLAQGYKIGPARGTAAITINWDQHDYYLGSHQSPAREQRRMELARETLLDAAGPDATGWPNVVLLYGQVAMYLMGDGTAGTAEGAR